MDCKEMILSEDTYDIITDFSASEFLGDDNNCYERIGEDFLILYLGNLGIRNPKIDFFPYHNMPKLYGLMQLSPSGETPPGAAPFDPASLIASGITQVQRPPLSLTGQGVILCFIDTGIDYQNPVFLDENGNSRILAIWDQTVQTGIPPDAALRGSLFHRSLPGRKRTRQYPRRSRRRQCRPTRQSLYRCCTGCRHRCGKTQGM